MHGGASNNPTKGQGHELAPPVWLAALRGRFLAFEGPDGSGKTTQYRRLVSLCHEHGLSICEVREPGGTPIGEQIRRILLDNKSVMNMRSEMLLYMASRAQLIEERIAPARARGDVVMADRFVTSTFVYQGHAGGLPIDEIRAVANVALQGQRPDLVLIFDVDSETAARRINPLTALPQGATRESKALDRIESRGSEFHRKVREGYLAEAKRDPSHHEVIDARGGPEEVWGILASALARRFVGG